MAQAFFGLHELAMQLIEIAATDIASLHPFQVIPDALIGVEIRSRAGKLFQMQAFGGSSRKKVFDLLSPMDGGPIPDHHDRATNLAQEHPQKAHDGDRIKRGKTHLHEQAPIGSDAANGSEVVVRQLDPQDRRLPTWGPGAHRHRQQIKSRFIYPDDGGLVLLSFFFRAGQRCSDHCLMASSLRCVARSMGGTRLQPASRNKRLT